MNNLAVKTDVALIPVCNSITLPLLPSVIFYDGPQLDFSCTNFLLIWEVFIVSFDRQIN